MMLRSNRGFSLLIGLLILVVLAIVGSTAVMFSTGEAGTATSRTFRRQALNAAEAGLHHFMGLTQPATPDANGYYVGNAGADDTAWQWLPEVKAPNGQTVQPRYQAQRVGAGPVPNSTLVAIRGQVVVGGQAVGNALLHAIVEASPGGAGGPTEQGQKSTGPLGGSSTIPIVSDITLMFD